MTDYYSFLAGKSVEAPQRGIEFIGTELHPSYFNQACSFLELAENNNQLTLLEA